MIKGGFKTPPNNIMFGIAKRKLGSIVKLDQNKLLRQILSGTEIQELIIFYNTEDQLFRKGQDKLGRDLDSVGGGYSPYTIQIKTEKGQPVDRVTLKDTGAFYDSFKVVVGDTYIEIIANPMKGETDINREWGGYVIGLQPENVQKVIDYVKEKFIASVKRTYIQA
jgi:hypothetical protein